MHNNRLYLVGAGPGDPDLLTVKALRLIQQAEVIVYDRLVSQAILGLIPAGTKRIYVGKANGHHHMDQDAINELLVSLAKSGRTVTRLKGGDPFTFGRGSEEARYLIQRGIDYEVVPGITAAAACTAYAGIPLTHRGLSREVKLVAGHCKANQPLDLDWDKLAQSEATLVFYMGLANAGELQHGLIRGGLAPATPAAIVENGTLPEQRVLLTTLDELQATIARERVSSPALLVVGEVVSLAGELSWFKPQAGDADAQALDRTLEA